MQIYIFWGLMKLMVQRISSFFFFFTIWTNPGVPQKFLNNPTGLPSSNQNHLILVAGLEVVVVRVLIIFLLSFLCKTRRCGDLGFVVSLEDLMQRQNNNNSFIHNPIAGIVAKTKQRFTTFSYFCGQNGLSKFGTDLAWGTMVLLNCFTAFSSSICQSVHHIYICNSHHMLAININGKTEYNIPF